MDLTTTYMGLELKNPLVVSAGPLQKNLDNIRHMEEAGAAAVVMYSLFEEQINHESKQLDYYISRSTNTFAEVNSYFPEFESYNTGPTGYLEEIAAAKEAVSIPIIGSLNGVSPGGWTDYAQKIAEAGADALELNIYYLVNDPNITSLELEDVYVSLVKDIRAKVSIPLAVKLSPFFTTLPRFANQLAEAGADGLVLFNRFYQPDFNLEELEVVPNLTLSTSFDVRLPLRWIAMLYKRVPVDFAATSGIHTADDVFKTMMAGASVAMLTSSLLKFGISHLATILQNMQSWMTEKEYESIAQMKGSMSQQAVAEPAAFERANYMKVLKSFDTNGVLMAPSAMQQSASLASSSSDEDFMSV
jgi:dihydroorotate dehydrogenase (fumarate)